LAPGGILIAAYLNAWGIARSLLTDAPEWFGRGEDVHCLLAGGDFSGARACTGFTDCVWSTPDDAQEELDEVGFAVVEEIGAEGFAGGLRNQLATIAETEPAMFERILAFAVLTSKLPQYRRASDHLVLAARS